VDVKDCEVDGEFVCTGFWVGEVVCAGVVGVSVDVCIDVGVIVGVGVEVAVDEGVVEAVGDGVEVEVDEGINF
jgi:hypothetical protein